MFWMRNIQESLLLFIVVGRCVYTAFSKVLMSLSVTVICPIKFFHFFINSLTCCSMFDLFFFIFLSFSVLFKMSFPTSSYEGLALNNKISI